MAAAADTDPPVPAVVIGDLNLARCLGLAGVPVLSLSNARFVAYSRYCQWGRVVPDGHPDRLFEALVDLGRRSAVRPVLLYMFNDDLCLISRRRTELARYFRFLVPPHELVEDLTNKTRFARLAADRGLPVPLTSSLRPVRVDDRTLAALRFPCLVKPAEHGSFERVVVRLFGRSEKGVRFDRPDALGAFLRAFREEEDQELIVQEYIEGGPDAIVSFHGFFDQDGKPLASFAGRKIRTYPITAGYSSCLALVRDPAIIAEGIRILQSLQFTGPVKIDFKREPSTGRLALLEINPRFTLWNYLACANGLNVPYLAYQYLTGRSVAPQSHYRVSKIWVSFSKDVKAFRAHRRLGELSWFGWLRSYARRRVYDIFSWRDPLPWVMSLLGSLQRRVRSFRAA